MKVCYIHILTEQQITKLLFWLFFHVLLYNANSQILLPKCYFTYLLKIKEFCIKYKPKMRTICKLRILKLVKISPISFRFGKALALSDFCFAPHLAETNGSLIVGQSYYTNIRKLYVNLC